MRGFKPVLVVLSLLAIPCRPEAGAENRPSPSENGRDMVLGLSFRGRHRAYPLDNFPPAKIINDQIRQQEVVIFHDAEKDFSAAYFRMVLGEPIEFGGTVVGTIAEDLTTVTRWDMTSGKAVAGNLQGMVLVPLPVSHASWAEWFGAHPDTSVYSPRQP